MALSRSSSSTIASEVVAAVLGEATAISKSSRVARPRRAVGLATTSRAATAALRSYSTAGSRSLANGQHASSSSIINSRRSDPPRHLSIASPRRHLIYAAPSASQPQPPHRLFSTTPPTHAPAPAPSTTTPTLLTSPSEPDEPDVFSTTPNPTVLLTDRAVKQLHRIAVREKDEERRKRLAFRIAVEPGGCHGYQYRMELSERGGNGEESELSEEERDDFLFQATSPSSGDGADISPIPVAIDSVSLNLLKGSTIDYVTELIGSQFAIKDNPQAKGAGCGCGVSWEPNI